MTGLSFVKAPWWDADFEDTGRSLHFAVNHYQWQRNGKHGNTGNWIARHDYSVHAQFRSFVSFSRKITNLVTKMDLKSKDTKTNSLEWAGSTSAGCVFISAYAIVSICSGDAVIRCRSRQNSQLTSSCAARRAVAAKSNLSTLAAISHSRTLGRLKFNRWPVCV